MSGAERDMPCGRAHLDALPPTPRQWRAYKYKWRETPTVPVKAGTDFRVRFPVVHLLPCRLQAASQWVVGNKAADRLRVIK